MNEEARPHRVYTVMRNLGIAFAITVAGAILWWFLLNIMLAHDIITGADGFWYFSVSFVLVFAMFPVAAVVMGIKRSVQWKESVDVVRWCLAGIGGLLGVCSFAASVGLLYLATFVCRPVSTRTFADQESVKADWVARHFPIDAAVPVGARDISISGNTGLGWRGKRWRYTCNVSEEDFRKFMGRHPICTNAFDKIYLSEQTSKLHPGGRKVLFGDGPCPTNFLSYSQWDHATSGVDVFLAYDLDTSTMHAYFSCH